MDKVKIIMEALGAFVTVCSFIGILFKKPGIMWKVGLFFGAIIWILFYTWSLPQPAPSPKAQEFLDAVQNVYEMVYNGDYEYGNSEVLPPCDDGKISGDRLVSRALWDMGYTNQKKGGEDNLSLYLPKQGFEVITDKTKLRAGDIVQVTLFEDFGDDKTYTFVLVSYNSETEQCKKYDMSPLNWKRNPQPLDAPLEESDLIKFRQAFRIK